MIESRLRNLIRFAICMVLPTVFAPVSLPQALVMPPELVDFAHAHGCTPIDDFHRLPGVINPPYVYGWLPGDTKGSAVFWCKKAMIEKPSDGIEKPYNLMFTLRDPKSGKFKLLAPNQLAGCPAVVEYWNSPTGLSIERGSNLDLSDFAYVTKPREGGPKTKVANAKIVVSEYDGVTSTFYCHRGQWLVYQQH